MRLSGSCHSPHAWQSGWRSQYYGSGIEYSTVDRSRFIPLAAFKIPMGSYGPTQCTHIRHHPIKFIYQFTQYCHYGRLLFGSVVYKRNESENQLQGN